MKTVSLHLFRNFPQTELALRGPGGEKKRYPQSFRDVYPKVPDAFRARIYSIFCILVSRMCKLCKDLQGAGKCPLILCKDLYYFLHSAGSRSARFPGCLPPASRRAFAGPKCQYFIRKMFIFSIRYCKMSLLHKENAYFQHSGLQNVVLTYGMAKIGILQIAYIYIDCICIYRLHLLDRYVAYIDCIYIYIIQHIWVAYIYIAFIN